MTDEQNRKIVEDYLNAWAKGDESKLQGILDNGYKFNAPPGFTGNKQGAVEMSQQYHTGFPDMKVTCSNWVIQGDNVAVRAVCAGTHQGEFMGVPATNKKAEITGLAIVKVRNGKVVEDISEFDQLRLLTQIGAIPEIGSQEEPESEESEESESPGQQGEGRSSASRPPRPTSGSGSRTPEQESGRTAEKGSRTTPSTYGNR